MAPGAPIKVCVLGVGLIGGSLGLAARRRLDAWVTGYDPEPATLERALELGALDEAVGSVGDACADAELVFCAAPVSVLPEIARDALDACGPDAVVSDV